MPSLLTVRQHDVFAVTDTHTQALLERMNPISSAVHPDKHTLKVYMVIYKSFHQPSMQNVPLSSHSDPDLSVMV